MGGAYGYLVACAIAAAIGAAELVSRYRDKPSDLLRTMAAWLYAGLNAAGAAAALLLVRTFGWDFGVTGAAEIDATQVLVAGFGSLALFRSSLFTVRAGSSDVSIGPSTLLTMALDAADLGVERQQGRRRAKRVKSLMYGVSFDRAKEALPAWCFKMMQSEHKDEQTALAEEIIALGRSAMSDQLKAYSLGLAIMRITGVTILAAAVDALRHDIST